ncbi:MAG: hypothetical protein FJY81_03445, partial [Candidatus Aminicenantes bacterium]|nr:hypothetical protein [Candidatus Aminicenantes bacterium]
MRQKRFQRAWLALSLAGILLAIAWAQRPNQEDAPFSPVEDSTALARALQALGQDFPRESPALPSFCADRLGQTWAVWEDWGPEPNRIKLTRFKDGRVSLLQDLAGPAGFNMTPRLAFDSTHAPWVIWMNYLNGNHRVFVQDLSSGRLWQLNSGHSASVASPQLVFDGEGNAWAFWNETWPDNGVIAYRVFNQSFWSPQQNFRPENGYPALNPDAAVDHTGTLWVAWASYDGHDYELFLARRTRNGWEKEARITDNLENDVFPALFMGKEGPPLVAWTQSTEYGHQVCAAPLGRGFLKGATAISSPAPSMAVPRLFKDRGETHVVWKSSGALRLRRISPRP